MYLGEQRAPASLRTLGEYSSLDRKVFRRAAHTQLLADARVVSEDGQIGVQLGHPLVTGRNGSKEFGCQVRDHSGAYDHIQIIFVGTGVSEGGEVPRMTIDSVCRVDKDLSLLSMVWIPMNELTASPPKDQNVEIGGENPLSVQFTSMPSQWPENWVMWSVRFYRATNPEEALILDSKLLHQARPQLLSFDWKPAAFAK